MAGKLSELTAAGTLAGTEQVELLQAGANVRATLASILASSTASEAIDDRVAALLVAGSNITLTYNDTAGTLTIASTGGGSASDPTTVTANNQGGTSYTLALTDAGKVVRLAAASAATITVPTHASVAFPTGTVISVRQINAGQITVSGSGVTLNVPTGMLAETRGLHCTLMIHKVGNDEWDVLGDLGAA